MRKLPVELPITDNKQAIILHENDEEKSYWTYLLSLFFNVHRVEKFDLSFDQFGTTPTCHHFTIFNVTQCPFKVRPVVSLRREPVFFPLKCLTVFVVILHIGVCETARSWFFFFANWLCIKWNYSKRKNMRNITVVFVLLYLLVCVTTVDAELTGQAVALWSLRLLRSASLTRMSNAGVKLPDWIR